MLIYLFFIVIFQFAALKSAHLGSTFLRQAAHEDLPTVRQYRFNQESRFTLWQIKSLTLEIIHFCIVNIYFSFFYLAGSMWVYHRVRERNTWNISKIELYQGVANHGMDVKTSEHMWKPQKPGVSARICRYSLHALLMWFPEPRDSHRELQPECTNPCPWSLYTRVWGTQKPKNLMIVIHTSSKNPRVIWHVSTHTYIYTCIYTYVYTCIYTCIYTYMKT